VSGAKLAPTPENIGSTLARNMFKSRGDNFEIHLLESDLALLIKGGCEIALDGVGTANVEALCKTRDALVGALEQLDEDDRLGCAESSRELRPGECRCSGCRARAALLAAKVRT
jgi:hypothetical protein